MSVERKYNFLALGDSYTIGEAVALSDNFPFQAARFFQTSERSLDVQIIAKTGWTTDELDKAILEAEANSLLVTPYDFVSLLIGVNNQYRSWPVSRYAKEFEALLEKAIGFAGNRNDRLIVLSIPDWSVTPYASGRDRDAIRIAIDEFNDINRQLTSSHSVHYLNITNWTREAAFESTLLAADGLHPSAREYQRWGRKVASFFDNKVTRQMS